jgi:hypothetical protein
MPTLDDAPLLPTQTSAQFALDDADLVHVFDVSAQKPKVITVADLMAYIDAQNV